MSKGKYPIGATWRATDHRGRVGAIWLADINSNFEVWRWSSSWSDGSGSKFDWAMSYKACKDAIDVQARFKREE